MFAKYVGLLINLSFIILMGNAYILLKKTILSKYKICVLVK